MINRTVAWFSAGAASAVASKLTLTERGHENVAIVYTNPGSEHPDNQRFIADCERWFEHDVIQLRSERYADTWQVYRERRFIVSPQGALCTVELKKRLRQRFELPGDVQVFGYTADRADAARAERFRQHNPEVQLSTPLIARGLLKDDCLAMVRRAGIELPVMYQLGYRNNNCIGCPKGGIGYWNKIRRDFPEVFARMAEQERELSASVLRDEGGAIWLDELDPDRGSIWNDMPADCSLLCDMAEQDIEAAA